ncbi:unnamed protein product [Prorocentrum cordatum]|uniref:Secreted protein n=1 Tax=Prorocentrum cordatum TaxID=2364126 RepID=A0ABN9RSQ5_9DINO|nr:unnamed protein product [Polarella glacialis]
MRATSPPALLLPRALTAAPPPRAAARSPPPPPGGLLVVLPSPPMQQEGPGGRCAPSDQLGHRRKAGKCFWFHCSFQDLRDFCCRVRRSHSGSVFPFERDS